LDCTSFLVFIFKKKHYGYVYVDKWNEAPIRLNFKCGATYVDNLL